MKVRVLGTAAGGGLPQWNCGCPSCTKARAEGTARTQDCLAISGDGRAWYLVNASPDLRTQLLGAPELMPPEGSRDSPLRGVLLTSAELDHTLGLLSLREAAGRLAIYATQPVRAALHADFPVGPLLASYSTVDWRVVRPAETVPLEGALRATAVALSAKRPRYATGRSRPDWTVAYRFTDAAGAVLVYAPGLAAPTTAFADTIDGADVVLLDGTFATAAEMGPGSATRMGHLPIEESLPFLRAHPGPRYLYTHLNNTNPVGHPDDPRRALLAQANAGVATDGQVLEL
ncbi:MAG: pyrroloquinoline quinone biosynthesis protein PqqB [Micromonosporaceae bacterium]|nr:pyrroloquinoline quinone biosynthesis protein PqqB [Micromonosporaceae bacterium]